MVERATPNRPMSVQEYLEFEKTSSVRHEYVGGEIHAMTGASRRHNRISLNIASSLLAASRGGPCRVYKSDIKVITPGDLGYYPDVMVACGDTPEDEYFEDEPCVLVEVTSPNTQNIDRREKLAAYKNIPSLGAYLIVAQDRRWIMNYFRDENGVWQRGDLVNESRINLPCPPGAELTLDDVYREIEA